MERSKWAQTGWKIEQKFSNKVLLGNWSEERLEFTREPKTCESTNREDYRPHWDFRPDVSERGYALLRAEGLPSKELFGHYCKPSTDYMVTQYGASYGTKHTDIVPTLEQTGGSDRPISGSLLQSKKNRAENKHSHLPSVTLYRSTYQSHPHSAFCQTRFARASKMLSSHFYSPNHNNKDLNLRQRSVLQVPDVCVRPL